MRRTREYFPLHEMVFELVFAGFNPRFIALALLESSRARLTRGLRWCLWQL